MSDQICNSCDKLVPDGDAHSERDKETGWNLVRCPHCGTTDNFTEVDERWAVDQLTEFVKYFRSREAKTALGRFNAGVYSSRLEIIKDMVEAEITYGAPHD
jgi:hypothetical protein|tara:strand:- start:1719 stop:2021 length:303 start_codon:yes stop_codon:yes gene_type:complete